MSYALVAIRAYLAERMDMNPALFVSHSRNAKGAKTLPVWCTQCRQKAVKAEGLEPILSAHDFRHYRATQLLREGMPLEVVQELLGHADVSTTRGIYAPVLGVQVVRDWLDNMDVAPMSGIEMRSTTS